MAPTTLEVRYLIYNILTSLLKYIDNNVFGFVMRFNGFDETIINVFQQWYRLCNPDLRTLQVQNNFFTVADTIKLKSIALRILDENERIDIHNNLLTIFYLLFRPMMNKYKLFMGKGIAPLVHKCTRCEMFKDLATLSCEKCETIKICNDCVFIGYVTRDVILSCSCKKEYQLSFPPSACVFEQHESAYLDKKFMSQKLYPISCFERVMFKRFILEAHIGATMFNNNMKKTVFFCLGHSRLELIQLAMMHEIQYMFYHGNDGGICFMGCEYMSEGTFKKINYKNFKNSTGYYNLTDDDNLTLFKKQEKMFKDVYLYNSYNLKFVFLINDYCSRECFSYNRFNAVLSLYNTLMASDLTPPSTKVAMFVSHETDYHYIKHRLRKGVQSPVFMLTYEDYVRIFTSHGTTLTCYP